MMFSHIEIKHNVWVRRALLTAFFREQDLTLFMESGDFVRARKFFHSLSPNKIQTLQSKIRHQSSRGSKDLAAFPKIVGLTKTAKDFLKKKKFKPQESDSSTFGSTQFPLPLRKWKKGKTVVRERIQCAPWIDGLILFYCLEFEIHGVKVVPVQYQWEIRSNVLGVRN